MNEYLNARENRKRKRYNELDITDSFMFVKVMEDDELCKGLLEKVLNVKIRKIKYLNYEETIQITPNAKGIRLDVYVEDDRDTVFNLEMQTTNYPDLPKRSRYYQNVIDVNILEKGESYDILNTSYVVFICTFDYFGKNRCVYEFENLCVDDTDIKFGDGTHKIFLNTKGDKSCINEELRALLNYFDGKEPSSEFTVALDQKVIEARENRVWRREYMSFNVEMQQQYKNGIEQGKIEAYDKINSLNKKLIEENKMDELAKTVNDTEYQKKLMKEYGIE